MNPVIAEQPAGPSEASSELSVTPRLRYTLRRIWQMSSLLVLAVALLVSLFWWLRPYQFHGVYLQSPARAPDFTLIASTGVPVQLRDFQGKTVVLFFGYTACPDICPLRLAELKQTVNLLGEEAKSVQVVLVTVDPLHDTAEQLRRYVNAFDPSFLGMTGSPAMINAVATQFGIFYDQETATTTGAISHTSTITVIDGAGYVRLLFPPGLSTAEMAQDLAQLLQR